MSSKRDSGLFAPGSISRLQSGPISRNGSHESLTAHPLLSPTVPTFSASPGSSISSSTSNHHDTSPSTTTPRYVPYTPRHRGAAAASVTTGTAMHSSVQASPQHHPFQGDATSKLQLMNLKAAVQKGGLNAASTGWAILEKLCTQTDQSPEWAEIWNAILTHKATLLLPMEAHTLNEPITPEFMKDHLILADGPSRDHAPFITLSGLRGILMEDILTIRSTLDPSSKQFQAIVNPTTRTSALASLPPLPLFTPIIPPEVVAALDPSSPPPSQKTSNGPNIIYPTYMVPSHHPSLPLPPRPSAQASSPSKPPLPPRPGARVSSLNTSSTAPSRLSNPFASLFGRAATPPPPASPDSSTTPLQSPDATPSDVSTEQVIGVPAFTIAKRINRRDVAKDLLRALHAEIRSELGVAPSWVVDRIEDLAMSLGLMPFVKVKPKNKSGSGQEAANSVGGYSIGSGFVSEDGIEGIGQKFQEFYANLEEELTRRKWGTSRGFGRGIVHHFNGAAASSDSISSSSDEKSGDVFDEKDVEDTAEDQKEKRVREVLEAVERTICSLFYDRLFIQPSSDDANHDEALSSRIAAVSLLDLNLSHLGVDVGNSGTEVEAVVQACGETLTQLDTACRAPADKASLLVAAHRIIVDGLSRLPPIRLKPEEDEIMDEKTPRAGSFGKRSAEHNEDDASAGAPAPPTPLNTKVLPESVEMVTSPDDAFDSSDTVKGLATESAQATAAGASSNVIPTLTPPSEIPEHTSSPKLTVSPVPPHTPTPVSGDIILPLMIFAVVKANPPHLVSHLLYTQRFRNQAVGGEESYCLINLLAVAEFLENVDLAALGLGEKEKTVMSTAELTPIPVRSIGSEQSSPRLAQTPSLRGRVEQQVDAIAGSANKVISGVVDSSFGVLRALLPGSEAAHGGSPTTQETAPWNTSKPGFGLLRRDTGFSIASLAASLPGNKPKKDEESGQQLVEVPSRPGSSRSIRVEDATSEDSGDEDEEDSSEEEEEEEYDIRSDTRSIRSFESMMSSRSGKRRTKKRMAAGPGGVGRKSLTDRLASMPGLSRLSQSSPNDAMKPSPPASRRSSLLVPGPSAIQPNRVETPVSSRGASPIAIRISPPNSRFLECSVDDLRVSEVAELLREYKRLAEAVRAMGGFHDE